MDVSIYELDFAPLFVAHNPGGAFAPLRNLARFRLVEGNYSLNWLNPETGAVAICLLLYVGQERLLFHPTAFPSTHICPLQPVPDLVAHPDRATTALHTAVTIAPLTNDDLNAVGV